MNQPAERYVTLKEKDYLDLASGSFLNPLTGELNRRGLEWMWESHQTTLKKELFPSTIDLGNVDIAVFFGDLAGLGRINSNHTQNAGDLALKKFAEVVRSNLDAEDILGMPGGDEILIVSVCNKKQASRIARRIVGAVRSTVVLYGEAEIPLDMYLQFSMAKADVDLPSLLTDIQGKFDKIKLKRKLK